MKKQFLFLAFFTLALIFAGTSNVFGQTIPYKTVPTAIPVCLPPTPFTNGVCAADPLHPVQGTMYTYTVTTTNASDDVRWFVLNENSLVAPDSLINASGGVLPRTHASIDPATGAGLYILSLGTNNTYNVDPIADATGTNKSIDISWKYFDGKLPNEVLLVAYVKDAAGCTNNIAVYRIIPTPAFTIDIASFDEAGLNNQGPGGTVNSECVSPIQSAFYTGVATTPSGTLTVDYGENWVFFVVNGANYIDSWMPEFQIGYASGTAPALSASWAYLTDANNATATWNTLTSGATWTSAVPVIAGGTVNVAGGGKVPAAAGECIVVRVKLDWGTLIEHDGANGVITFAANGVAFDGVGTGISDWYSDRTNFEDLHHATCAVDGFNNDVVNYNITPRPQVEAGTPIQEIKTGQGVN